MRTFLVLLAVLLLAGCKAYSAKHNRTILMNSTGERQECEVGKLRSEASYTTYEECIENYKAQGYKVWGQY